MPKNYKNLKEEIKKLETELKQNGVTSMDFWPMNPYLRKIMKQYIKKKQNYYKRIKRKLIRENKPIPCIVEETLVFCKKGEHPYATIHKSFKGLQTKLTTIPRVFVQKVFTCMAYNLHRLRFLTST